MEIIMKDKLIEKLISNNLTPLEVRAVDISNKIELNTEDIDYFLSIVSDFETKYIYYYYIYYSIDDYIIPEDWFDKYPKNFVTAVRQYNANLELLDFDLPKNLILFSIDSGTSVRIVLHNYWIKNKEIKDAEIAMENFENEFYSEVHKTKTKKIESRKVEENELRDIIFDDPEFSYCKNQSLRYYYLLDLLEKENMNKYKYLVQPYGAPHIGKVKMFMDKTWVLYKEQKK